VPEGLDDAIREFADQFVSDEAAAAGDPSRVAAAEVAEAQSNKTLATE
jgi:hypothetical protein